MSLNKFYLKSDKIFLEDKIFNGYIKIENEIITEITEDPKENLKIIDYTGDLIVAGYFDTHIHGYKGYDVMDGTEEALKEISNGIVENGVTSFLATTLTDSMDKLIKACENVSQVKDKCKGAKIQGIFLEGPFFSEEHKGAQDERYMTDPNKDSLDKWIDSSEGLVNKIALAPELKGSNDFIKYAVSKGIKVAIGHTSASYEEAIEAVNSGASIFVHTYNGMSGLHHRNPGVVGAALDTKDTFAELICDGHHLHPAAARIVINSKPNHAMLITDCMMAGGKADGDYKLGNLDVVLKDGAVRLKKGNSLAGSVLKLDQAVRNLIDWGQDPLEVINMASLIPAKSMNLDKEIGSISPGKRADINILNRDYTIKASFIDGVKKI